MNVCDWTRTLYFCQWTSWWRQDVWSIRLPHTVDVAKSIWMYIYIHYSTLHVPNLAAEGTESRWNVRHLDSTLLRFLLKISMRERNAFLWRYFLYTFHSADLMIGADNIVIRPIDVISNLDVYHHSNKKISEVVGSRSTLIQSAR